MIGLPTEGIEEIEQTFDLITSLPMDYVSVSVFTPYPGTEIYRQAVDTGFYDRNYWREFAQDPRPGFSPRYWNEHFTDDELLALLKQAYRRFYRRPSYILGRLVKVRSLGELLRKGIFGVKLLRELHAGRPRADQGRFPNGR
jgi:anaerobic magnesium-protoporphyrin IX monomethyl ester cyclase